MLHVAKLFPKNDASSFDAYGRIFSGTLRPGDEVRDWGGGRSGGRTCSSRLTAAGSAVSCVCVFGVLVLLDSSPWLHLHKRHHLCDNSNTREDNWYRTSVQHPVVWLRTV